MLLLDTHVVLWLYASPERVSKTARDAVLADETVLFSAVSAWEHGIKRAKLGESYAPSIENLLLETPFQPVDFPFASHSDTEILPDIHRDPFDRMLIAHARYLDCPLVTKDTAIRQYPVKTIW